jgi:tetratricopeptide (TPR) repeat protein
MGNGPLDDPRLRAIEERLNSARFDDAQRLLSALSERDSLLPGASYLTTRLLYQRGRLDLDAVVQRLRDVLEQAREFPEASALLLAVEDRRHSARVAPLSDNPTLVDPREPESWKGSAAPEIPRAPTLPQDVGLHFSLESPKLPALDLGSLSPPEVDLALGNTAPAPKFQRQLPDRPPARDTLQELISIGHFPDPDLLGSPLTAPPLSAPPSSGPASSRRTGTPPSSNSAWRKQGELLSGDTVPPSSTRTERPVPADFELGPRNDPSASLEFPTVRAPDPSFSQSQAPSRPPERVAAIRSVLPATPEEAEAPTGLGVAALLDDGEPARALALLDRWGSPLTPELVILKARALAATGRRPAALDELDRVAQAPLIEPELRASAARLMLEVNELTRALAQAERAYEDDPGCVMVRLTLAWALVRAARRSNDDALYRRAESLLSALRPRATPMPALVHGLRACVMAVLGDPERAITTAQLSVGLDPRSTEALVALSLASARLSRRGDAERAWLRLREIDRVEAESLSSSLEAADIDIASLAPSSRRLLQARAAEIWDPVETALTTGRREAAIGSIERLSAGHVRAPGQLTSPDDFTLMANEAARFFTSAPVFRHFAPFDLSLSSTSRLEAALSILYGSGARVSPLAAHTPIVLLIGSYLGECVRHAFGGRWRGTPLTLERAAVEARGHEYVPFERVEQRLKQGRSIRLDTEVISHPAAEPNAERVANDLVPPTPWDPREWPEPYTLPDLARALRASVVALYTAELCGGPLDGSVASVATLDHYISLLAPATAPPDGPSGWARRVAALAGGYLVEVLCDNVDAAYVPNEAVVGPLAYEVVLSDSTATHPVLHAYERLSGKRMTPLADYVSRLTRRR